MKLSRVAMGLVLLVGVVPGCGRAKPDPRAAAAACFRTGKDQVLIAARGRTFGGWALFAVPAWRGHPYGLDFEAPGASPGCGTVGADDAALGYTIGSMSFFHGKSVLYVFGAVLAPVAKVRVSYEGGPTAEITPARVAGLSRRIFVDVRYATTAPHVTALDRAGRAVGST